MSDTVVSLLTPSGTGAIATIEVRGPRVYPLAKQLFTPAGKPLPEVPEVSRFWFGVLGGDEVVLAVTAADAVEVHCHGGRRVVRWVVDQFLAETSASGGRKPPESSITFTPTPVLTVPAAAREDSVALGEHASPEPPTSLTSTPVPTPVPASMVRESLGSLGGLTPPARLLQQAPTLRTASVLLDQLNGAFANELRRILALLETDPNAAHDPLGRLAQLGCTVGRHIVEPWKVVVAGPPNVGKSSLINALAGFQRAVVSDVAGTTRDAVSVQTAFDGWPVELIDTAGLRDAGGLEAEGIEQARRELDRSELVVWVVDGTAPKMIWPSEVVPTQKVLVVVNKSDVMTGWGPDPSAADAWGVLLVSAVTGTGVSGLATEIVARLVPGSPSAGAAVPFTPDLVNRIESAHAALVAGQHQIAVAHLREALAVAEAHHFASPFGLSS